MSERKSTQTATFTPELRALLGGSGVVFVVSLALVLIDVVLGIQLPALVRPLVPWVLLASMLVGTTLLVGALGMPRSRRRDEEEVDSQADGSS